MEASTQWPKTLEPLTREQEAIYDDFMKRWHEILPRRFGLVERFIGAKLLEMSRDHCAGGDQGGRH